MSRQPQPVDRREFIKHSAAISLTASGYRRVLGSMTRLGVGFIGVGARGQAHIDAIKQLRDEGHPVSPTAVCDVWDGYEGEYVMTRGGRQHRRHFRQGLYPSAKRAGLNPHDQKQVMKDYRRLLELPEVDVVCIATPDHWHARMSLDALAAGKHIYCERPLAHTIDQAQMVFDRWSNGQSIMTIGVQELAHPIWDQAHQIISQGRIGKVTHGQSGTFRNDSRGYWRFYPLWRCQNPSTIDWDLFLGHRFGVNDQPLAPKMPFDRAKFAQWRCYWDFGGGPFTEHFLPTLSSFFKVLSAPTPMSVVACGGQFIETDGREIPDVLTMVVTFHELGQLSLTSTTTSSYPMEELIRGRLGTIKFTRHALKLFLESPDRSSGFPGKLDSALEPSETIPVKAPRQTTLALWQDLLDCIQRGNRVTQSPPNMGFLATVTAQLGVQSYRTTRPMNWPERTESTVPSSMKKHRSLSESSTLHSPDYMSLAGPWKDGVDPAT